MTRAPGVNIPRPRVLAALAALGLAVALVVARQGAAQAGGPGKNVDAVKAVDVAAVLRTAAPDLAERLAKFKPVRMPFDAAGLTPRERQLIDELVIACRHLEGAFWRQSDPDGFALFKALEKVDTPVARSVRHLLLINGSRWDLVDENRPFVGGGAMPPGHALYPSDLTRTELESYVAHHPEQKASLYHPHTVIRRRGATLVAEPYHSAFKPQMDGASAALRRAADLSDDPAFARFLRLRADALGTDDYYASDIAWIDLKAPKVDIIFAPYETYLDDLAGIKTSYGAAVLVRNEAESRNLSTYQQWVPDIQEALPLPAADRPSKRGQVTPMEVMDAPFRAGDMRHGYQAVADNLPNDPRIHKEKGTKKIFFKNFLDARVNEIILPLAGRVMDPAQARRATAGGILAWTVMHEIGHGLGPAFARQNGRDVDIREAIGGAYSGLEEAKADVVGIFALKWLVDRGVLPKTRLDEYYASYVASIFRTLRFGTGEAHGRAQMMEFNVLAEAGAIVQDGPRYKTDFSLMPMAIAHLAKELLEQEASGDRARSEAWFKKYGQMPPALKRALASASDVPVDVDPTFAFSEAIP